MEADTTEKNPDTRSVSDETKAAIAAALAATESPEDPLKDVALEPYEGIEAVGVLPIPARHLMMLRIELEKKPGQMQAEHVMKSIFTPYEDRDILRKEHAQLHADRNAVNNELNRVVEEELGLKLEGEIQYLLLPSWELGVHPTGKDHEDLMEQIFKHLPGFESFAEFMKKQREEQEPEEEESSSIEEMLQNLLGGIFGKKAGGLEIEITVKVKLPG